MTTEPGWVVEPKPVPEALTDTFSPATFNGIEAGRDWVPLADKLDLEGMAALMKFAAIGEPQP